MRGALALTVLIALLAPRDVSAAYAPWVATTFGALLVPAASYVGDDGGVDVVFHFHGAQLADHEWRASGLAAVIVDADFGGTSSAFSTAFDRPERFGEMEDEVLVALRKRTGRTDVHAHRVGLIAWSAGYAAVERILAVPSYFDAVDVVVLLDSLHAPYVDPIPPMASEHGIEFRHLIDERPLAPFIRFGKEATAGKKLMVVTHSAILPPDYGSTTETAFSLILAVDARVAEATGRTRRGMWKSDTSDAADFHVRGYWGAAPSAHVEHLHLVDDVVREFVAPRWGRSFTTTAP